MEWKKNEKRRKYRMSPVEVRDLMRARSARAKDRKLRETEQLTYVGLFYRKHDYISEPYELYVKKGTGSYWIRQALSEYVEVAIAV